MPLSTSVWDKQLVLVTGKGGVGKTSLTAALAKVAHAEGRRVLVAEVAPDTHTPSPLLSHFGHPMIKGEDPVEIEPGLYGVRIAAQIGHRLFLRAALRVRMVVDAAMRSAALTRFLMAAPTFPEIGILYQLVALLRSKRYAHVIVDLPATGHAVALASLPSVVLRIVPSGLIGDAIREGLQTMTDPEKTVAVVATLPESMPVTEAKELIAALEQRKVRVGAAILNRVPPDPFSAEQREALRSAVRQNDNGYLLGMRELRRLERAHEARELFYETIPDSLDRIELPAFDVTTEAEVIDAIALTLRGPSVTDSAVPAPAAPEGIVRSSVPPEGGIS